MGSHRNDALTKELDRIERVQFLTEHLDGHLSDLHELPTGTSVEDLVNPSPLIQQLSYEEFFFFKMTPAPALAKYLHTWIHHRDQDELLTHSEVLLRTVVYEARQFFSADEGPNSVFIGEVTDFIDGGRLRGEALQALHGLAALFNVDLLLVVNMLADERDSKDEDGGTGPFNVCRECNYAAPTNWEDGWPRHDLCLECHELAEDEASRSGGGS